MQLHDCGRLLTQPGLDADDTECAISHQQVLRQCDNYLWSHGIAPRPTYDTAGSAKMIPRHLDGGPGSELAGRTFGIEDDGSNFTRLLLLGRSGVVQHLNRKIPSKTSLVFTLLNSAGGCTSPPCATSACPRSSRVP